MADLKNLCREELKYRIEICKSTNKNDIILLQKILYNMNNYVIKGKNSSFGDKQTKDYLARKQIIKELDNKGIEIINVMKNSMKYRETKLLELQKLDKSSEEIHNIKIIIDLNEKKISQLIIMSQENDAKLKEKMSLYKKFDNLINERKYEVDKDFLLIRCHHCKGNDIIQCPVCCGVSMYKIYKITNKHKIAQKVRFDV